MSRAAVEALLRAERSLPRAPDAILDDFDVFENLIERWQSVQNLVSRETPGDFWTRHVLDSLQLLSLGETWHRRCLDLGSGGGFPALPLAIACKGGEGTFDVVEANGRKCAYLNAVKRGLGLALTVHNCRIERYRGEAPALITARALAGLPMLMAWIGPLAGPDTRLLLHKGRDYGEELAQLDSALRANVVVHPSLTSPDAVILEWPAGSLVSSRP